MIENNRTKTCNEDIKKEFTSKGIKEVDSSCID
jgi:hypothetical protein